MTVRRSRFLAVPVVGLLSAGVAVGQQEESNLVRAELLFAPPLAALRAALAESSRLGLPSALASARGTRETRRPE